MKMAPFLDGSGKVLFYAYTTNNAVTSFPGEEKHIFTYLHL